MPKMNRVLTSENISPLFKHKVRKTIDIRIPHA